MSNEDYRAVYVSKIKELASSINDDIDETNKISELEEYAKQLKQTVEWLHSGWYIAIFDVGSDDNFSRCYKMLGFMTEAEALELLDKIVKDFHGNGYYKSLREVTKKEWDEFYHLKILTGISNRLKWIKRYNDVPETVVNDISTKIGKLSGRLGLCHRWEHVVE